MPEPGWYPDPGGRSGHYRFWDGQAWGLSTTPDLPTGGGPGRADGGGSGGPRRSRGLRVGLAATAAAVVLVLVAVGALVLRERTRTTAGPGSSPTPAATRAAPSASEPATPGTAAGGVPTAGPSTPGEPTGPVPTAVPSSEPCLFGSPYSRQDYPRDGRVHGGSLSFPLPAGWTYPGRQVDAFTWAYDVGEADTQVQQQRYSTFAVGAVSVADGFEDPAGAAERMMGCTLASTLSRGVTTRTDLVDEETTVGGYPAWTLRSEVRAGDPRSGGGGGDTVQITVVDLDSGEALAFFWGSAPLGDAALTDQLDRAARQLEVG